jgi:CHAT domain-containing protein/tetratricopeptide (TPR) repeat protein
VVREKIARRLVATLIIGALFGIVIAGVAHAQDDPAALNAEVVRLYREGKYAEATEVAKRSLLIREQSLGPDHPDLTSSLSNLAALYESQGRLSEAEMLLKRIIAISEKHLGPDHIDVGVALKDLGKLYQKERRTAEAELLLKRSLAIAEKALGSEHAAVGTALNNLAELYEAQARYREAQPLYERGLAIAEKARGSEHPDVGTALGNLVLLYLKQGRELDAEPLLTRSLAIHEKILGPDHPFVGTALTNLGGLFLTQGRFEAAEPLFKRSLAIAEAALGPDASQVGNALNNLGELYRAQGRTADAEQLLRRSLHISEKLHGPNHPDVGLALDNLGQLYRSQGRIEEAAQLLGRSIEIRRNTLGPEHPDVAKSINNLAELSLLFPDQGLTGADQLFEISIAIAEKALGPEHPGVGAKLNNLAMLYVAQGRGAEAEPLYRRSLAIAEKALGSDNLDVAAMLNNLANLYHKQARFTEAEPLYRRSLAIHEKMLGPGHPSYAISLNNLAVLAYEQSDWARAADFWRRATGIIKHRVERGLTARRWEASGSEVQRFRSMFWGLVKATQRLAAQAPSPTVAAEMLEVAQWAQASDAAASLAQMAARSAKGSPELGELVRERQDLVGEWQAKDTRLIAAKREVATERKADMVKALADRLAAIDIRLTKIDGILGQHFPDYRALASPAPLSVSEVQALLRPDEALVLFLDMPEWKPLPQESFMWFVTKTDARWVRSDLGTATLASEVAALRCGLDATAWYGDGAQKCAETAGIPLANAPGPNQPLPFDHGQAHRLYAALFGEAQDLIKGKHLLIVPSGPLTQLPFQVLVTKQPTSSDHRSAGWLSRDHAISVLPAVSSLRALRRVGKPSAAQKPMIGFGNPLLDGPDTSYSSRAELARAKLRCPGAPSQRLALAGHRGGALRVEVRGGLADVAHVRMQVPLPETADELCAVAHDVKAEASDIRLGAQATEREIKALSASGSLANYRMVHFATHGFLAGQFDGTYEPGLILTPPDNATAEDDGYLSASEIAALKLDADWVILSACNTAAGAATSAEALSGLARAFIYAQARALLVSHWEVYSDATVKLITTSVREMTRDPTLGRAEALRRSMLALIDKGKPQEAHPAYWAPFVVVGEGGPVIKAAGTVTPRPLPAHSSKPAPAHDWRTDVLRQ